MPNYIIIFSKQDSTETNALCRCLIIGELGTWSGGGRQPWPCPLSAQPPHIRLDMQGDINCEICSLHFCDLSTMQASFLMHRGTRRDCNQQLQLQSPFTHRHLTNTCTMERRISLGSLNTTNLQAKILLSFNSS